MSVAGNSKRNKLSYNIGHSNLSDSDKLIFYAMRLKYIDGEQLLEFLEKKPTIDQVADWVEERLRENRVRK